MMYRCAFVLVCAFVFVASREQTEECKKLGDPKIMRCCKEKYFEKSRDEEVVKECLQGKKPLPSDCDVEICIAKKVGYAGSTEGTFDKKATEASIKDEFKAKPELAELIIDNCVNNDNLNDFGDEDMCDLIKMGICVQAHLLVACDTWESDGECKGTQELVQTCTKAK